MIIVLCSPTVGAGKDTVAEILRKEYGFKQIAFADEVKRIASMIGWDGRKDDRGRKLIIDIAETAKEYNPTVWVDLVLSKIMGRTDINIVVSDYRYLVETKLIETMSRYTKVIVVGVERDDVKNPNELVEQNQSEYDKLPKSVIIKNNGTIEDLERDVRSLAISLRLK